MAAGEAIGCFGLTEPDAGSDPGSMRTRARRDGDDWILNGTKMWITNGSVADIAVVWARTDDGVRGFLVPAGTPGFTTQDIHQKLSLRASITSELILDDVRLPADAQLPEAEGLRAPLSCLSEARFGIVFGAVGAGRACYESALDYSKTREQFGKPIGGFQLVQAKLAQMLLKVNQGTLLALHLGRMKDGGTLRPEHVSFGKLANVNSAHGGRPRGAPGARRQRDHARVPGDPAHEQPRVGRDLRGHGGHPHAGARPGAHRARRLPVSA